MTIGLKPLSELANAIKKRTPIQLLTLTRLNTLNLQISLSTVDLQEQKIDSTGILIIEDRGPGIPEKDRERVFDRFVRLNNTESDESGIGLTIVTKILALHHAKIELDTPIGHPGLVVRVIFKNA